MAARTEDLRAKITTRAHCALLAHARAHGIDKPELVSQILDDWAARQIHGATLLARCLRAKGEAGAVEGIAGAAQGIAGQPAESLDWDDPT
jgi:hypothetical protein